MRKYCLEICHSVGYFFEGVGVGIQWVLEIRYITKKMYLRFIEETVSSISSVYRLGT